MTTESEAQMREARGREMIDTVAKALYFDQLSAKIGLETVILLIEGAALSAMPQHPDRTNEIAARIHYPACWDTACYETLDDALAEIAGCIGCNECAPGGKRPDADQRPTLSEDEAVEIMARHIQDSVTSYPGAKISRRTRSGCRDAYRALIAAGAVITP